MSTIHENQQQMYTRKPHPRYVIIEGVDGSGKTTLCQALHLALAATGVTAASYRFPSMRPIGMLIRHILARAVEVDARSMLYLWLADALDCEPFIKRQLDDGMFLIADRHTLVSGTVYQQDVFTLDEIYEAQQRHQFRTPDRVYVLDVPVEVMEARLSTRATRSIFERDERDYQEQLRRRYLGYALAHQHAVLLDGTLPIETLIQMIMRDVTGAL